MLNAVKRFIRQDRDYFFNNQGDILRQNSKVIRIGCVIYLIILAIYTAITAITGESKLLLTMYIVFDVIHILLCALVLGARRDAVDMMRSQRIYCGFFEFTLLAFFVLEAVFPFPDKQSIYFPFPIILAVTLLVLNTRHVVGMCLAYCASFVVLVCIFKDPEVRADDIYIAAATLASSLAGYVIVASLRHETGGAIGKLRSLSMMDPMTGLYNKQTFESLCRAYMEDDVHNRGYAMLFFDVDKFKQINDTRGHQFGDRVLKGISDLMRETFYEKDYLCRFGGDEFVVFMLDVKNPASVDERVRIFCGRVKALGEVMRMESLSCSVGSAIQSPEPETYAELLSRADAALYVAKASGKQQVSYAEQELITRILKNTGAQPSATGRIAPIADTGERTGRLRRIMIVDDNEMNRQLLRRILGMNYDVLEAENGQVALEMLREWHESISAVLLDIVMPVMDGYEMLRQMRMDSIMKAIPVIVTTGYGEEEAEIKALSLGANDFVVKPYRPSIIIHRLQNTINLRETNATLAAMRADY